MSINQHVYRLRHCSLCKGLGHNKRTCLEHKQAKIVIDTPTKNPYWNFHGEWNQDVKDVGKWMLFYPKDKMDEKWQLFCKLRDEGKLGGVQRMKCSTGLYNPRATSQDDGVIILYCCNSTDKETILETGRGLFPYLQDYLSERIYYKTDIQTSAGTIATGAVYNHTYTLQIPRQFLDDD